jgi:hypothetical protein
MGKNMNLKSDSVLRVVFFLYLGMIGFWILSTNVYSSSCGLMGFGIHLGSGQSDVNWFNPVTWNLDFVSLVLFRIFCFFFFIALTAWLLLVIRDFFLTNDTDRKKKIPIPASESSTSKNRAVCVKCGKSIETDWKVCAFCGEDIKASS